MDLLFRDDPNKDADQESSEQEEEEQDVFVLRGQKSNSLQRSVPLSYFLSLALLVVASGYSIPASV
jgi:hypothetical protein